MPKTQDQIAIEVEALKRLAQTCPDDDIAQASIAGQINVLEWVIGWPSGNAMLPELGA